MGILPFQLLAKLPASMTTLPPPIQCMGTVTIPVSSDSEGGVSVVLLGVSVPGTTMVAVFLHVCTSLSLLGGKVGKYGLAEGTLTGPRDGDRPPLGILTGAVFPLPLPGSSLDMAPRPWERGEWPPSTCCHRLGAETGDAGLVADA